MPASAKTTLAIIIPILNSSVLDDGNTRIRKIAAAPREVVPKSCNTELRISDHRLRILANRLDNLNSSFGNLKVISQTARAALLLVYHGYKEGREGAEREPGSRVRNCQGSGVHNRIPFRVKCAKAQLMTYDKNPASHNEQESKYG